MRCRGDMAGRNVPLESEGCSKNWRGALHFAWACSAKSSVHEVAVPRPLGGKKRGGADN